MRTDLHIYNIARSCLQCGRDNMTNSAGYCKSCQDYFFQMNIVTTEMLTPEELETAYQASKWKDVEERSKQNQGFQKAEIPDHLRWEVFERDNFTCKRCGSRRKLTADHIIAESKGGPTTLENLQTLCKSCNSKKGTS